MASVCFEVNFLLYTSWIDQHMGCGNAANLVLGSSEVDLRRWPGCSFWWDVAYEDCTQAHPRVYTVSVQIMAPWHGRECQIDQEVSIWRVVSCLTVCVSVVYRFLVPLTCASAKQDLSSPLYQKTWIWQSGCKSLCLPRASSPLPCVPGISIQHLVHMTGT